MNKAMRRIAIKGAHPQHDVTAVSTSLLCVCGGVGVDVCVDVCVDVWRCAWLLMSERFYLCVALLSDASRAVLCSCAQVTWITEDTILTGGRDGAIRTFAITRHE